MKSNKASLASLSAPNPTGSASPGGILPPPFSVAMLSDPHSPSMYPTLAEAIAYINDHEPRPKALMTAGDMNDFGATPSYRQLLRTPVSEGGLGLHPDILDLVTLGNHDTETPIDAPSGSTPADPHLSAKAEYEEQFANGNPWHLWDYDNLRVLFPLNLSDVLNRDNGNSCYHNCCPPGDKYSLNPDFSGWTVPSSPQRMWMEQSIQSSHDWKFICVHRPFWNTFDGPGRPLHREGRDALRFLIDKGLDGIHAGDHHVGSLLGRLYPDELVVSGSGNGSYHLTLAGGATVRASNLSLAPAGSILWAQEEGIPYRPGLVQVAILTVHGPRAWIKIRECRMLNAQTMGTPVIVHDQELVRNLGLAS